MVGGKSRRGAFFAGFLEAAPETAGATAATPATAINRAAAALAQRCANFRQEVNTS